MLPQRIMASKSQNKSLRPILYFGNGRVEWIPRPGEDDCGYRRDETESLSPKDQVRVARGLVRESGVRPGKCTVLLGGKQVKTRTFSLGQVPAKEWRSILRRKAANLLEVEAHQVVFTALPLVNNEGESDLRWLVSAMRLDDLRSLQLHLLKDGFRPKRFLFARQAMLRTAESYLSTGSEDEAWVIAGVEDAGVAISLVAGGELVQQSFVPGQFEAQSAMAASVLQEMRGFESYWRRFSRGGAIDDLFVAGLTHDEAEQFELACKAALPNSEFLAVGGEQGAPVEETRSAYLATCAAGEGPEGDLTLPMPVQRGWVAAAVVAMLALGLWGGNLVQERYAERADWHAASAASLSTRVPELESIQVDLNAIQSRRDEVQQRRKLARAVGTAGLELSEWVQLTREAFEGHALLESLHVDDGGGEMSFSATGRVASDPSVSTPALAAIDAALGQHPHIRMFKLRLPSTVQSGRAGLPGLEFRITGAIGEQPAEDEVQ